MKKLLLLPVLILIALHGNSRAQTNFADALASPNATAMVPPAAPSNLTAVAAFGLIALGWDDNSFNELGFSIERSTDGLVFDTIDSVNVNINYYTDQSVTPLVQYYYRVSAYNADGQSPYSDVIDTVSVGAGFASLTSKGDEIDVFPNPSSDVFHVSGTTSTAFCTIIDAQGRVVYQGGTNTLDLSGNAQGVYFLLIQDGAIRSKRTLVLKN